MRQTVLACLLSFVILQGSALAIPVLADVNVNVSDNGGGSTSNVHVESHTGNNTICVNNKCSSAVGSGQATVCINGHCTTTNTGTISVQSDNNDHTQVNIDNSNQSPTISQDITVTISPPPDIKPTIEAQKKELQQKIDAQKEALKKKVQEHQSFMEQLFGHELDFFKSLFDKFL